MPTPSVDPVIDPARCPLCTQPNACQIAAGSASCWCFDATVSAAVLARVPAAAQGVACVCRGCATAPEPAVQAEPSEVEPSGAEPSGPPEARRAAALRWLKRP